MTDFTLYGARGSSNADRVRLVIAEGGIANYKEVQLDFAKRDHKSPENIQRHPWGKVPAVVFEDGFTLYESRPICQYIARKYKLSLLPTDADPKAMALFEQASSVEANYFNPPAGKISFEKFAKARFLGLPADEAVVEAAVKELDNFFAIIEGLLQDKQYMAGDNFSLVDIYYIPLVQRLFMLGYSDMISGRQNVAAWWERCVSRPAIKALMAADAAAAPGAPKKDA